jgi:dTDP-4-dehydrorhamnose 3,5-epimerase
MILTETPLPGAFLVEISPLPDERGFFARTYCTEEFAAHGLECAWQQCSVSSNTRKGTLRGLHYQRAPHEEHKLVRCTTGEIFDVIVDIRPNSATYRRWYGLKLTAANHRSLFIPPGFAHGFVTLSDDAEVSYMISVPYAPDHAQGFRWDDPAFAIRWPIEPSVISPRDAAYALLEVSRDR